MSYYDALIAKWATLTPGTTDNKLAQINGLTVTGSIPATFTVTGQQLFNCLNWAEFAALTPTNQQLIMQVCAMPGPLIGGAGSFLGGMFVALFPVPGVTISALTALARGISQPWWQASVGAGGGGLASPVSRVDLDQAGGLT